jgi:hypothetical protein
MGYKNHLGLDLTRFEKLALRGLNTTAISSN